MRAVLLPGLDGCAELRAEFVAALAPEFDATVIAPPAGVAAGYDSLLAHALGRLPRDRPFLLIGESFSGPLAIRLAASRPPGLAGLVLCATFARSPFPARWLLGRLARLLPLRSAPMGLVMQAMMGRWATPEWSLRLRAALDATDVAVLRHRMSEVVGADVRADLARIACPIACLDAGSDRLLWFDGFGDIRAAQPRAQRMRIEGPHMLLQAAPSECARAIKRMFPA